MAGITTAFCTSAKQELFEAGHNFNAPVTPTATAASGATSFTAVSSMAGVSVGSLITGTGITAGSTVAAITSGTAFTSSLPTSAAITGAAITIGGDVFKMALIIATPTGTYSAANVNYADIGADEVTGTGYTAGGQILTDISAVTSGTTAYISFGNPSWPTATFSTSGCMIYNASIRAGGASGSSTTGVGRALAVFSFAGVQTVSAGTFSVLMPTASASQAVLRIA